MPKIQLFQPILIMVGKNTWEAIPLTGKKYSTRDRMLIQEIKLAGGIDESVAPGAYHFNIIPNAFGINEVSLIPTLR